ncbi:MAG: UbiA family prenyltransferase [Candidatus Lernaella stagnicola]|nr:UbiA family prenyltransferase [Candidatus Lernaella stagnicola]
MNRVVIILRFHIIMIGIMGALVFGWLLTGHYLLGAALLGGVDWLLVNLLNRVSDTEEDRINRIPGADGMAEAWWPFAVYAAVFAASLVVTVMWFPALIVWRLFMQTTGFVYNFKLVPAPGGFKRLKEVYFLKNLMSGLGFVTTCFFYPLAVTGYQPALGWGAVVALIFYFLPFELTYEILYDLRDVEGDRVRGVPTYPVVHGPEVTHRIIFGLLAASVAWLAMSFFTGLVGAREFLLAGGPVVQLLVMRPMLRRGPSIRDCIFITNLGWGLLAFFLLGTWAWLQMGLPANIFL